VTEMSYVMGGVANTNPCSVVGGGPHGLSTSYDGFTLYPAANTISGTCRVYGFSNTPGVAGVGPTGPTGPTGPAGSAGGVGPTGPQGPGSGDVVGPAASVTDEIALFSGTTGKLLKRATGSGIVKVTSGVMSIASAGVDYDGGDYLVGRFTLPADAGSAIGPAISNFFGTNSAIQLVANTRYLIHGLLFFLKTTAEAVTITLTASSNVVGARGRYIGTPTAGAFASATSGINAQLQNPGAATAIPFPATPSLTTAVDHTIQFWAIVETGATATPNIRVNVTCPAGTVTPRKWSTYQVFALSSGNIGTFVA